MAQPPSISLDPTPHPALSYAGLRAEALELLGRLCGEQWSDFNSHDPGITILEQLCYALTELAWRCRWPVAELLADAVWPPATADLLHGDPVTADDMRDLLRTLGCQTVVVAQDQPELPLYFRPTSAAGMPAREPATALAPPVAGDLELDPGQLASSAASPPAPIVPRGVWRIATELGTGEPGQAPTALLPIARRLHGARLLGRDLRLEGLNPFEVVVTAELELASAELAPDLPTRLRARLDAVIHAAGASANSEGLRGARLIQALQSLPEVRRVTSLALAACPTGPFHPWHLPLPGGGARLHPASTIRFSHRGLPLEAPATPASRRDIRPAPPASAPPPGPATPAEPKPDRRPALARHRSLARQLPAVYGVGPAGLPADATPERRARALQLRAYLLLFDQLLANGQAQLARAGQLLAPVDPADPHPLDAEGVLPALDRDLPLTDLTDLLRDGPAAWPERLRQALAASAPPAVAGQRAALLAHLLRLFGEELDLDSRATASELVTARSEVLRRIVPLTAGRGSGPDLLAATSDAADAGQGAFAERLRRKLGLPLAPDGNPPLLVIEHLLLRPLAADSRQRVEGGEDPIPFLSDVARPDPWSGRVSVVINAALLPALPEAELHQWLARHVRQELPAHLRAELHLLADGAAAPGVGPWSGLRVAWDRFRALLQTQRLADLGAAAATDAQQAQLHSLRLRDSRDRLITLLRIGLPWPLRAIPLPELLLVPSGLRGAITLPYSQRGVRYQLVEVASGALVGAGADGTDGPLTLHTNPIDDEINLRVLASVLAPRRTGGASGPSVALTANGRARSTLLAGEIRVVEGLDGRLPLRLLNLRSTPLPRLHPEATALIADHGQRLVVEVEASQEGVVYEVIDNSERHLPAARQTPLSARVIGTSRPIRLELRDATAEDRDLTVRASHVRRRGRERVEERLVLEGILPLRVRANAAVPLRLLSPVLDADATTAVAIGATPASSAAVSQTSVRYQLQARPLTDHDWRFDAPATATALTTLTGPLEGFTPRGAGGEGNGAVLTVAEAVNVGGEGQVVAALAHKEHRLSPLTSDDARTLPSVVPLRQAAVALTRPDARRHLILRREDANGASWSLWGGQPGVAYSLHPGGGEPQAIPEREDAPGGRRGIGRARVGRDLVVDAVDGLPRLTVDPASTRMGDRRLRARFLRNGVEVDLDFLPILVWADPQAVGLGEGTHVVVTGLEPGQRGRLLRGNISLREGRADGTGQLRLFNGSLSEDTSPLLDVGVRCPVPFRRGGGTTDRTVGALDLEPLQAGAAARLVDWGASVDVEVADSLADATYRLINAADCDKPVTEQQTFGTPLQGTGGPLRLRADDLREDIDLMVRRSQPLSAEDTPEAIRYLAAVVPLRVRPDPAVAIAMVEPVLDPGSECLLWVGDAALPSSASVNYSAWSRPLGPEDWMWPADASEGTPRLPSPPSATALAAALADGSFNAEGWKRRGEPQRGTGGDGSQGVEGRLRLSLGPAGADAAVVVVASKRHSPGPLDGPEAAGVASQLVLPTMVVQRTRPDPDQRLALVADAGGWRLAGGEGGVFYTVLRQSDRTPLGRPLYVHGRASDAQPKARGLGQLRLGLDTVVEGEGLPALALGPTAEELRTAVVEARRAVSGTTGTLRQAPVLVTQEPPQAGATDTSIVVVWGLAPGERTSLWRTADGGGIEPVGATDAGANGTARLPTGPLPAGTPCVLAITLAGGERLWSLPLTLLAPGAAPP